MSLLDCFRGKNFNPSWFLVLLVEIDGCDNKIQFHNKSNSTSQNGRITLNEKSFLSTLMTRKVNFCRCFVEKFCIYHLVRHLLSF